MERASKEVKLPCEITKFTQACSFATRNQQSLIWLGEAVVATYRYKKRYIHTYKNLFVHFTYKRKNVLHSTSEGWLRLLKITPSSHSGRSPLQESLRMQSSGWHKGAYIAFEAAVVQQVEQMFTSQRVNDSIPCQSKIVTRYSCSWWVTSQYEVVKAL